MDFEGYLSSLAGKRVGVIGVGVSNRPLIERLLERGVSVTARDRKPDLGALGQALSRQGCRLKLGRDYLRDLSEDVIFRTPGLRPDGPELLRAAAAGSVVTSEMEVFFRVCPCPILGVTGSDGKTTTTTIAAKLLSRQGRIVHLGGNIGHPLLCDTPQMAPEDLAVLELSSFQLMTMDQSPHIALITNLSPNHLDVHRDYREYVAAKANLFTHQTPRDIAVFNADNADCIALAKLTPGEVRLFSRRGPVENGVFCDGEEIFEAAGGQVRPILNTADILLPGQHNVENYLAAFAALRGMVTPETMGQVARSFSGVEHRIELIRRRRGVSWYNDSIASSPSRTIAALRSFSAPVILIAGGKDKGVDFAPLGPVVNEHVKLLLLCGDTAGAIRRAVEGAENYRGLSVKEVPDYHRAVALADAAAAAGDAVLLSPASTSFDRFENFEERGRVFKAVVQELP